MRKHLLISASILAYAVASPAMVQSASAQTAADDSQGIEQVVVTAERHTSTVQKTAASITVRSGEELLAQGRYSLANILEDVPGVSGGAATTSLASFGSGSDNPSAGLTIRGISSNIGTGGSVTSTAATAAIYVDDVYNGLGGGYDINRVEVLRGPQGTLYGRSATSGVVSIHTNDPNLDSFGADATAELGSYNVLHYAGDLNLPIVNDELALRISGNYYHRDGFYTRNGGDHDLSKDFRLKLLWQPSANFSALLGFAYNDVHNNGSGLSFQEDEPHQYSSTPQLVPPTTNRSMQVWANFNLDLGGVHITYIPAYRTFVQNALSDARGSFLNFNQAAKTGPDHFITHELRVSSNTDSTFRWQAGAFYYENTLNDDNSLVDIDSTPPYVGSTYLGFDSSTHKKTTELGLFAETTWAIMPDTRLTTGIRWDTTKVVTAETYSVASVNGGDPATYPILSYNLTAQDGTRKFNNLTYKARLEHDLTPENLIYGLVSSGFSPGDVSVTQTPDPTPANPSGIKPVPLSLKAETLTAYEIGSKNRFMDDTLQVNGDVYYYDYAGYQVANINVSTTPTPIFTSMSVPMISYGAELEVLWRPWEGGLFSGSVDYNFSKYHDIDPATEQYFAYHHVPGVPPLRINAEYTHTMELTDSISLILNGVARFNAAYTPGEIYTTQINAPLTPLGHTGGELDRNDATVTVDLNATLNLADGKYSLTGYVRNVGDVRYMQTVTETTLPFGTTTGIGFNDPRTYGVVGTVHF